MSAIVVEELRKTYGTTRAVDGISFEVAQGETFALLGPNGAGKTTAIEILEGYRRRDSGHIRVLDFDPETGGPPFRSRIGIVLQASSLERELTVFETLCAYTALYPRQVPPGELLSMFDLEEIASKRVKTLSGGQQRRLELALGLVGDPDLIFLDEPTTGLDPSARRRIWDMIGMLSTQGKTVILSTHYLEEVQVLARRIAILQRGRIRELGTPEELHRAHAEIAHIGFTLEGGLPSDFPDRWRAKARAEGDSITIETADPVDVLADLTPWARDTGRDLAGLYIHRPTLEDIYLHLTREDAEPET